MLTAGWLALLGVVAVPPLGIAWSLWWFRRRYEKARFCGVPMLVRDEPATVLSSMEQCAEALRVLRSYSEIARDVLPRLAIVLVPEKPGPAPKVGGWVTIDRPLPFGLGPYRYRVHLDPRAPGRVLVHEVVEHCLPHARGEGMNPYHRDEALTALSERIQSRAFG